MNDFRNLGSSIGLDLDKSLGEVLGENLLTTLAKEWFFLMDIDLNNVAKRDGEEK